MECNLLYRDDDDSHSAGRPRLDVDKEDILSLRRLNYSWTKIARVLGISRPTLYRRLHEYGIDTETFTDISEPELNDVVEQVKAEHPNIGEVMLYGHLLHMGIKVPRAKLRSAIHHVDHANTVSRQSHVINRRVYSAPRPNAVWHIDGNHKMIRWRLVVHGGVDGFSRCIVYMKCANNNCATTVKDAFLEGVSEYGTPAHVRSDHGGENVEVWKYMLSVYNDPSCVLTGRSTHNERIERLWRDVSRCVSSGFKDTFSALEAEGVLNPMNEIDIFCLHFVFLPRLNKSLADFQGGWNCHPLSTEGNMSPLQLFAEGLCNSELECEGASSQTNSDTAPNPNFEETTTDDLESVQVPSNKFVPCSQLFTELQSSVDPMSHCTDFGKGLYYQSIQLVGQHLQIGCSDCQL